MGDLLLLLLCPPALFPLGDGDRLSLPLRPSLGGRALAADGPRGPSSSMLMEETGLWCRLLWGLCSWAGDEWLSGWLAPARWEDDGWRSGGEEERLFLQAQRRRSQLVRKPSSSQESEGKSGAQREKPFSLGTGRGQVLLKGYSHFS